jgi:hypothetical protein
MGCLFTYENMQVMRELSTVPLAEFPVANNVVEIPPLGLGQLFYTAKLGLWFSLDAALNWSFLEFSIYQSRINIIQTSRACRD